MVTAWGGGEVSSSREGGACASSVRANGLVVGGVGAAAGVLVGTEKDASASQAGEEGWGNGERGTDRGSGWCGDGSGRRGWLPEQGPRLVGPRDD